MDESSLTSLDIGILSAIGVVLCGAIGVLWKQNLSLQKTLTDEAAARTQDLKDHQAASLAQEKASAIVIHDMTQNHLDQMVKATEHAAVAATKKVALLETILDAVMRRNVEEDTPKLEGS